MLVNWEDDNEVGSVGKPGPGMGVRLGEDDEIELTGPNVFLGYYKQPELTAQAMTADGWIKTGDLGRIEDRGFTYITGRKKDIIITAGGKNISPAPMEDVIDTCPIVAHAVVVGDGKPFVSALIELDPEMLHSWLEGQGLDPDMSLAEASGNDAVRAFVQQYIDQANANVSRAESVRKFAILDEEFNQEHGTLTPSMKVVRPKVLQRYTAIIEEDLYAPKPSNKPLPATAKIIDSTVATVKKSSEQVKQASEQMKASVSDSIASVSEKIKKTKNEADEAEASPQRQLPMSCLISQPARTTRSNEKWPFVRSGSCLTPSCAPPATRLRKSRLPCAVWLMICWKRWTIRDVLACPPTRLASV